MSKNFYNDVEPQIVDEGSTNMQAKLKDGKIINISGYDLKLGRFDCDDGVTRTTSEFEQFIIPESEMQSIIDMLYFLK